MPWLRALWIRMQEGQEEVALSLEGLDLRHTPYLKEQVTRSMHLQVRLTRT